MAEIMCRVKLSVAVISLSDGEMLTMSREVPAHKQKSNVYILYWEFNLSLKSCFIVNQITFKGVYFMGNCFLNIMLRRMEFSLSDMYSGICNLIPVTFVFVSQCK